MRGNFRDRIFSSKRKHEWKSVQCKNFCRFYLSDPDFSLLKKKFLQKKRNKKIAQISYCMFFNKNLWNYYYVFLQYLQLFQSKNEKMKLQAHSFIFFSWSSAIAITQKFRCASPKSSSAPCGHCTPDRTLSINGLKSRVFKLNHL